MNIPSDYLPGYERARAIDSDLASKYIAHTLTGDPLAELAAHDLAALDRADSIKFIGIGVNEGSGAPALQAAPASLREFFKDAETEPEWLNYSSFAPGIRMFHRNSYLILVAFVTAVLIEGFTTNIARSFMLTGRVRDRGKRRLGQNNRHMTEIFFPGGLHRQGDGWKLSVRIRLIHAQMRHLLNASEEWDSQAWGIPISNAHLGFAISAFSARLLIHMKTLGARYSREEYDSFMNVWRYTGHLMGIPGSVLFKDAEDALRIHKVGYACEPNPSENSIVMAHSLINSAPLIAGAEDPRERRKLARYVYRVSRELIGNEVADNLNFPKNRAFGTVGRFRWKTVLDRWLNRLIPGRRQRSSFNRFGYLLAASAFDDAGISYSLPDHVYAEESSEW